MSGSNISMSNTFDGGMVADLHALATPSNTVTYALNMELITTGDNQYIFQNIKGNEAVVEFPKYTTTAGNMYPMIPLGVKTNNNIAYILLGAFDNSGAFLMGGVGTFPSPNWDIINAGGSSVLENKFSFLCNYLDPLTGKYDAKFLSTKFNFEKNRHIEIEIQGDYDGSVNLIFTDDKNTPFIINSRFNLIETSRMVTLSDRFGTHDSNIYSEDDWDRIALVQNNNFPITTQMPATLPGMPTRKYPGSEGFEVIDGGYLRGGGYRYYFKYTTPEGNTTELLYESPLIPISNGKLGLNKTQVSSKLVRFFFKDLDASYSGIKVYFALFDGKDAATTEMFEINYVYTYSDTNDLVIVHTGLEAVTPVDITAVNIGFTPIDTVKSIAIVNDRLALAGVSSTLNQEDIETLKRTALSMSIIEKTKIITESYADAETAGKFLGYWPGEVYEFGAVFMLRNKGLSPVFPVTGMDNLLNTQRVSASTNYPYPITPLSNPADFDSEGFSTGTTAGLMINNRGLFRTSMYGTIFTPTSRENGNRTVRYVSINTSALADITNPIHDAIKEIATGFFIVRRKRNKNVLFQGLAMPTLKLPAAFPERPFNTEPNQALYASAKRYIHPYYYRDLNPAIGLNGPFHAFAPNCSSSFDTVFVPQPTPTINVITADKAWVLPGSIGHAVASDIYGLSLDRSDDKGNNKVTDKAHIAIYSPDIELAFPDVKSSLNGNAPSIELQKLRGGTDSPVGTTSTNTMFLDADVHNQMLYLTTYNSNAFLVVKNTEPISMDRAATATDSGWLAVASKDVKAYLVESGRASYIHNSFSSKADRTLGILARDNDVSGGPSDAVYPFYNVPTEVKRAHVIPSTLQPTKSLPVTTNSKARILNILKPPIKRLVTDYFPNSLIQQNYSKYLGVELTLPGQMDLFNFAVKLAIPRGITSLFRITSERHLSMGHLVNVYRSATGRWSQESIRDIYKYDSNKAYFTASPRYLVENTNSVDVFRGDGFISKIYKKATYKIGVAEALTATAGDAYAYGVGNSNNTTEGVNPNDIPEYGRDDRGRGLYDVGQVIEIASYSNVNADIRSIEDVSPEENIIHGGGRNFYPNKEFVFSDPRPDSSAYNHGYTGDVNPISYSRIEENSPAYNTEFPNRILVSPKYQSQSFFNSFRDFKGFNYRDYGVELGPIIKIVSIKNMLLSIHPTGVLAIGVDEKTLLADGTAVFVNTAQALSTMAKTISDMYGASHAEAVTRTDSSVVGMDFSSSVAWLFEGDKLTVISEFTVKTILEEFKNRILVKKGFINDVNDNPLDMNIAYIPRVYTTFNHSKHTVYFSYIAEHPDTHEQFHAGTITYNTILQKWMSEISEGNKFSFFLNAATYTTGFSKVKLSADFDWNSIWREDALPNKRATIRGVQYNHEFEIILNKEAAFEKVLNNLRLITNKSIPINIIYTTSGDENDAAVDIWGNRPVVLDQPIITRNSSSRKSIHLGILDENAYYKNSGLYIEVGKINYTDRKNRGTKRVRDKTIRVRFIYSGQDETFIQGVLSMLSLSHS